MRYGPGCPWERRTTAAGACRAIHRSQASPRTLARRHGTNPKTVHKWKQRSPVADRRTGPKEPRPTVLSLEEKVVVVALPCHTLLPLDDCLYALQATIPHLTRSALHRCLQRHGISQLSEVDGDPVGSGPTRSGIETRGYVFGNEAACPAGLAGPCPAVTTADSSACGGGGRCIQPLCHPCR
jgi:transposase-like protein